MKNKYRELCAVDKSVPLFSQPWWLDAICGEDGWDVKLVIKGGKVAASLPYVIKTKFNCFTIVTTPSLTQCLGPHFFHPKNIKQAKMLSNEKNLLQELFSQLPPCSLYSQNWHYTQQNWLPLYWLSYTQTTRYTYVLKNLRDVDEVYKGLQSNIRGDIKKAHKKNLYIDANSTIDEFIALNEKVFSRQGLALPYDKTLVKRLYSVASERKQAKFFIAKDMEGNPHAGNFIVWDDKSAYYIMGGGDPELRNSGATSFCMWEAINFASNVTEKFDFEGSMLESVERFFRAFGAEQVPYFSITKVNSRPLNILLSLKSLARSIL